MKKILIGKKLFVSISLLIYIVLVQVFLQPISASTNEIYYSEEIVSYHVYQKPSDEGYPTWELFLNVTGSTPNSTLQEYNISLEYRVSGSQEAHNDSEGIMSLFLNQSLKASYNVSNITVLREQTKELLKEGDILDAQFFCNTSKLIVIDNCVETLAPFGYANAFNTSDCWKTSIYLECNITLGGTTDTLQTIDDGWYIKTYPGDCKKVLPGYPVYGLIGFIGITIIILIFASRKMKKIRQFQS